MPYLSVIVPFFRNLHSVEACLLSIRQSDYQDYEIIVADDAAAEAQEIADLAAHYGALIVRLQHNSGPASARNRAARAAIGEILVFFDADVAVHHDTLSRFAQALCDDPSLDALVGSYDLTPRVDGYVAAFRNLLHAYVHHRSAGEISTFWAGCGAVRRETFAAFHGFDESFRQPSVEDVEFGSRLHEAGAKLRLDPAIQVTHLKEWTLASMIYADVFLRARPWTELMLRHGLPHNLNFRSQDRLSVAVTAMLPLLSVAGMVERGVWWIPLLVAILGLACLQFPLWRFLARQRGPLFSVACFPLLLAHYFCAAAGFAIGLISWKTRQRRLVRTGQDPLSSSDLQRDGERVGAFTAGVDGDRQAKS
jgi:GT2 family glycosyltransferase